jgi:hypothetical protein
MPQGKEAARRARPQKLSRLRLATLARSARAPRPGPAELAWQVWAASMPPRGPRTAEQPPAEEARTNRAPMHHRRGAEPAAATCVVPRNLGGCSAGGIAAWVNARSSKSTRQSRVSGVAARGSAWLDAGWRRPSHRVPSAMGHLGRTTSEFDSTISTCARTLGRIPPDKNSSTVSLTFSTPLSASTDTGDPSRGRFLGPKFGRAKRDR